MITFRGISKWRSLFFLVTLGALVLIPAAFFYLRSPSRGLPYHDSLVSGHMEEWVAYSGNWRVVDGTIKNDSIDPGAKFITGSSQWSNYSVEANVQLLGEGDAGLITRASDLESGADSYKGYYAGLRTRDQKLVLGKADHGWTEFPSTKMPGGVVPGKWYHITLSAFACTITASAMEPGTNNEASVETRDPQCFSQGKFGLRSLYSGGIWSDITATRLQRNPEPLQAHTNPLGESPVQADHSPADGNKSLLQTTEPSHPLQPAHLVHSIKDLRLLSTVRPVHASVQGSVIVTEPLYIQDANGGILVEPAHKTRLRTGEEVEAIGDVYLDGLSATMRNATLVPMGGGIATRPPLSVTAEQAATGAYQGMFIQVQGTLHSKIKQPDGTELIEINDGQQSFYAVPLSGLVGEPFRKLELNSVLSLRGICLVDVAHTQGMVPFSLLVVSREDVRVTAGPPWWSAEHLIGLAITMLGLGFLAHFLYSRAEEWRLRAVINERERLAYEIHDTLAQSFAGIGFQLRAIRNRAAKGKPELTTSGLVEELDRACELVRQSHNEARRTIITLRPDATEAGGLVAALEQIASKMVGRAAVKVEASVNGAHRPIPLHVLDSLFRIGQEAIANAVQHGHPTRLRILATYAPNAITLLVADNGDGFTSQPNCDGFGLAGIRRRVEIIQGELTIESAPGSGTSIAVKAPIPPKSLRLLPRFYHNEEETSSMLHERPL